MERRVREDLTELFGLWLDPQQARAAAEDVRAAERMIELHPAPLPAAGTLDQVRRQMRRRSLHRRRVAHFTQGVAAVAAVILIAVGPSWHNSQRPHRSAGLASLIPAALWETDDIASDDVKLAYFNTEVDRLEAQVEAIENGDADTSVNRALNDVEMELFQIDTDFWKG